MAPTVKDRLALQDALYPGLVPRHRVGLQVGDPNSNPFGKRR